MIRRILFCSALIAIMHWQSLAQGGAQYKISGRVVSATSGQPLAGTEVSFGNAEAPQVTLQKLLTGADGEFEFVSLHKGKYWLAGQNSGFRKQMFEEHGGYASAIAVADGKNSSGLVFRLHPDARIVGTLLDDEGEAIPDAMVLLFRADARAGYPQVNVLKTAQSDVEGNYAFTGLEEGRYYLAFSARPWFTSARELMLQGKGQTKRTALLDMAYPITLYPGAFDEESAAPIILTEGEESVANMELMIVPAARVSVHGLGDQSESPTQISLQKKVFNFLFEPMLNGEPDGELSTIRGVPVGRYTLTLSQFSAKGASEIFATIDVTGDTEIDRKAAQPAAIHGRVLNRSTLPQQAFIRLWNAQSGQLLDTLIGPDGDFEFASRSVTPGTYSVFVFGGIYSAIERISASGATVLGQTVLLQGATPVVLKIEVCQKTSTVEGTASSNGKPTPGLMIVLVPDDFEHNLASFRRDQSDSDGTFMLASVLPGHYKIVALEDGWGLEWANLAIAKAQSGPATEITVTPQSRPQTTISVQ
jgi:hypothetical protein